MTILENLTYRIERIFNGERGIVEKVELASTKDKKGKFCNYFKDHYNHLPRQITFRNPLGKLVERLSPITQEALPDNIGLHYVKVYKTYKPGDEFP